MRSNRDPYAVVTFQFFPPFSTSVTIATEPVAPDNRRSDCDAFRPGRAGCRSAIVACVGLTSAGLASPTAAAVADGDPPIDPLGLTSVDQSLYPPGSDYVWSPTGPCSGAWAEDPNGDGLLPSDASAVPCVHADVAYTGPESEPEPEPETPWLTDIE